MHYRHLVNCILCLSLLACGGGGGSNSGNIGDTGGDGTNPPPVTNATSTVLAFNDLGMHCMDREFSVFSILPPFNVVHSQVVLRDADGRPYLADEIDVEVFYDAVPTPPVRVIHTAQVWPRRISGCMPTTCSVST